jgi:FlgD Ig-like domain
MKPVLILFIFFISIGLNAQNSFYVATTGSNANNGSFSSPWKTIQHGADQLSAGDTLNILAGTYSEKIELNSSGSAGQMITIRAFQNADVRVDASSFSDDVPLFYAGNKSNFRIEGIHFTNNFKLDGAGFFVDGAGRGIEVVNCIFSNIAISKDPNHAVNDNTNMPVLLFTGSAASDSLANILISGNEVFNCRPGYSECISLGGNVSGFIVEDNTIHDNANIGIAVAGNYNESPTPALDHGRHGLIKNNLCFNNNSPYAAAAGIYVDGGMFVTVENNVSYANDYGGEIGCEESGKCAYVIFRNNLFYNNKLAGMALGGYDANTGGFVEYSSVTNNTFFNNDTKNDGNGELLFTQFENSTVSNNIFYLSSQDYFLAEDRAQPNLQMDYNLVYNLNGKEVISAYINNKDVEGLSNIYSNFGIGAHDTFGDPFFVKSVTSDPDFHLTAGSVAINAGDPNFTGDDLERDLDGHLRIADGRVDCGADEYNSVTGLAGKQNPVIIPGSFFLGQNYPNPFNPTTSIRYSVKNNHAYSLRVNLTIYTVLGEKIRTLVDKPQQAGKYKITWDAKNEFGEKVVSGVYFYRLKVGRFVQSRKMILVQ